MSEKKENKKVETGGSAMLLRTPFEFDGETVSELTFDFNSLTGADIISVDRQYEMEGGAGSAVKETTKLYQSLVAAKAANVPFELTEKMGAYDFSIVTMRAQNFLFGWE